MSEFSDNIHHCELKEMRLAQSSKCVVHCLLVETGEYAVHLNSKEKEGICILGTGNCVVK